MAELFDSLAGHILQPTETVSDLISSRFVRPIVRDKPVKLCDPGLNRSREIKPEAVCGGILTIFCTLMTANRK